MRRPRHLNPLSDAIVATLVAAAALAVVLPVLRPAADAQATTCLDRLRKIGLAARVYTDDYSGCLLPYAVVDADRMAHRYTALLAPVYLKDPDAFVCPSDHLDRTKSAMYPYMTTFGVNWYLSGFAGIYVDTPVPARRASTIKDPSHTIWAADTAAITAASAPLPTDQWQENLKQAAMADIYYFYLPNDPNTGAAQSDGWNGASWSGMIVRPFPRHAGRVNTAFYDGHAASVPASQFDPNVTKWGQPGCWWDNVPG